jgi:hypothetical protein
MTLVLRLVSRSASGDGGRPLELLMVMTRGILVAGTP